MKKLLIIGGVIILVFALIIVLNNKSNEAKLKDNPYGNKELKQPTIDLLGNENYDHIVMPETLINKIESGEPVTAYFFHPECGFCMEMTPIMMPIAKEMGVDVMQLNMLEYGEYVDKNTKYDIKSWPQLVHYKNGERVGWIMGVPKNPEETIREFFNQFENK